MDQKNLTTICEEQEIPEEVEQALKSNRAKILKHEIKQERIVSSLQKGWFIVLTAIASLTLLLSFNPQMNLAIKQAFGINEDPGVNVAEENQLAADLHLVSTSNDLEITLTKFVTTKTKLAFDYQFKITDDKLKKLLEKNIQAKDNHQFIELSLYANGSDEDIYGGVFTESTFRVEGEMFYGSVISVFTKDVIPEDAELTLKIKRFDWQDKDEFNTAMANAPAEGLEASFTVDNALEYEGDWSFNLTSKPLTETASPTISKVTNVKDVQAISDALQTDVTFTAPLRANSRPAVTVYKDSVKQEQLIELESYDPLTGEINFRFSLSALDKSGAIYKIQLNEINAYGEPLSEIGSFELRNT
ncbi:hypothetical protein MXE74_04500 [Enterococcus faecalis]|uniref:hypothetical protein n=1 Tax=Enterococcus faecalis TaxID=1351 RepID=UPI002DBE84DC|nr:hypothetical protein [Enterococcus faecalis]MEB5925823.1 hypothetical protein [Enterococcus faecalis]